MSDTENRRNHIDRVVYILGAGFSALLGLPVVSNFILKSKDMYANNAERYPHFSEVYQKINEMSVAKNYFDADLFNIEEVLSIVDMESQLGGEEFRSTFIDYISDVVKHYTPNLQVDNNLDPWQEYLFGVSAGWLRFCTFVATMFNQRLEFTRNYGDKRYYRKLISSPNAFYDIVSLNYDCALEIAAKHISDSYGGKSSVAFNRSLTIGEEPPDHTPLLAKLHGCVDTGSIIPPTWSKSVKREILAQWQSARKALSEANHIRVLGYSLPTADSYVKYLFKTAIVSSPHLKTFDVITLDGDGSTKRRYDEFVTFKYKRFKNADLSGYLNMLFNYKEHRDLNGVQSIEFNQLEHMHEEFMSRNDQDY